MNKEIHYEGWLIKSPPTKRIWRARWRRRWFTLKQGEIPEQFCLEYYTDRNCRKLKGIIDLDQCEQVDCGLRLENRKQKFQFMFDIKTPRRIYYLAADTEADMRDWVNCICQVCHLHDTKQSGDLQDDNHTDNNVSFGINTTTSPDATNDTTTTSLNSTGNQGAAAAAVQQYHCTDDILRHPEGAAVIVEQPHSSPAAAKQSNNESTYANTEYTNRETIICDTQLDNRQQAVTVAAAVAAAPAFPLSSKPRTPTSPVTAAIYLNSPILRTQDNAAARLAISSNGVVRKIPEKLVLKHTPLSESLHSSNVVQPSPAPSTASGPYIPISECFSGSIKQKTDGFKLPPTSLNNMDLKCYDTPRSHNIIAINMTKESTSSPKTHNCSESQTPAKNRSGRSDSDSESVFTDDEEWTHPMPLRENTDRSTRPSDSSVENEAFVFTYSQRFSKIPDNINKEQPMNCQNTLEELAKNNLVLDVDNKKETQQDGSRSDGTEQKSPPFGPRDANSLVDESYDIPRSHNLPYCNMEQLFEKAPSSRVDPIASSTPNLLMGSQNNVSTSPSTQRTLQRHCYTNAAPSKMEGGNVFSYDFMEQSDLPPVNRNLKPKVVCMEDKPPEEVPAKPPVQQSKLQHSSTEALSNKITALSIQCSAHNKSSASSSTTRTEAVAQIADIASTSHPPTIDRKLKPNAYKLRHSVTMGPSVRRSTGAQLSMLLKNNNNNEGNYIMETLTLPRQLRHNCGAASSGAANTDVALHWFGSSLQTQQQRAALAAASLKMGQSPLHAMLVLPKNEHKLQYFDLDVSNPPPAVHRHSMSVGNLNVPTNDGGGIGVTTRQFAAVADPSGRAPIKSTVVYNSVDFIKTEAFNYIREERERQTEKAIRNNL